MTEFKHKEDKPSPRPYQERSGVNAEKYFEEIISGAQIELPPDELELAKDFATGLFKGEYSADLQCGSKNDLEKVYRSAPDNHIQTYYAGYFETPEGQDTLSRLGFDSFLSFATTDIQVIKDTAITEDRKKMAKDSRRWYLQQLADELKKPDREDGLYNDVGPVEINYQPEKLLEKLEDLQAYRRFFREVRREVKGKPETALKKAQETLLTAYRGRINDLLARHYKDAFNLVKQLNNTQDSSQFLERLGETMPVVQATFLQEREDRVYDIEQLSGSFSRRLDFIRNGAAWSESSDFTPISSELSEMASNLNSQTGRPPHSELAPEEIERLNQKKWNARDLKSFAETVITEWGLLSAQQCSWLDIEERDGPSDDGRWQVVITPKSENMSVDGAKRVFKIPESYLRTTFNTYPAGAVPGVAHELMHMIQYEIAERLYEQVPLARIKGRHTNTNMELGTINQERIIQSRVGKDRPVNVNYLEALSQKLSGGNRLQVARAFYESNIKGRSLSEEEDADARLLAADRTNRFYTMGGHNSAPLAYLEQELLRQKLEPLAEADQQKILVLGSVFDLPDLSRLVRAGLISYPENLPFNVADDVWHVFVRDYVKPGSPS